MKYIDAEKLKTEITRLKGQLIRGACASQIVMETNCKDEAYNEVLAIITSLQQEQPEVDLGREIEKCLKHYNMLAVGKKDFTDIARHFYGLGKARKRDEAPTSPDFDTEVYNWLKEHGSDETRQLIEMAARHFWKMGRRDERIELMKNSVEALVCAGMEDNKELVTYIGDYETFLKTNKIGDKVKVIILKVEDEK